MTAGGRDASGTGSPPSSPGPRISGIRLLRLDPYGSGGAGTWNLLRVDSDAGVWGLGEAYWGTGLRPVIDDLVAPALVGQSPFDIDRLTTHLHETWGGAHTQNGLVRAAISGVEIALWDLVGKLTGQPVTRLLGGRFRDRVRLYRTGMPADLLDPAACRDWAAQLRDEQGYTAIKSVDVDSTWQRVDPQCREPGHEPLARTLTTADLRRSERSMDNLRAAFGEEFDIAVHCHWRLDLPDATRLARAMAPYEPIWLEDPLPVAYSPAWRRLCAASPVPICTGENLYSRHEFRPFIEEHGADIVQVDIPKSGGFLETKRIADLADLHNLKVASHNPASVVGTVASAQVAATIRGFTLLERAGPDLDWWEDLILHDGPVIDGGFVHLNDRPGLGIALNPDVARAHLAEGETWWGE